MSRGTPVFVLVLVLLVVAVGTADARTGHQLPQLRGNVAEFYMGVALEKRFGNTYTHGYAQRIRCHKRHSRTRIGCEMGWTIGDTYFYGKGRIWYSLGDHGNTIWNYGWDITELNDYCLQVEELPRPQCTTHHHVD